MIYKVYLIDGDGGISLLETTFVKLKKIDDTLITNFFNIVNRTIDNLQEAMAKGRRIDEMTREIRSEESTVVIYFHPLSRILFCAISDADDKTEKIKEVLHKIGQRFWKKHQSDLKTYRITTEKTRFQSFTADIENLTLGGKIAEVFPKLLLVRNVLEKILSMGMIEDFEFQVALLCDGKNSPLAISRKLATSRSKVNEILKKLEDLDIISFSS
ncbi:MAG: hypothetical protein R6U96_03590 [Promethearchaeia archaeon]